MKPTVIPAPREEEIGVSLFEAPGKKLKTL
jgi:hypothetical protein